MNEISDVIHIVLDEAIGYCVGCSGFFSYYEACNDNLSLEQLMKSAKKVYPSFCSSGLKRKLEETDETFKLIKTEQKKSRDWQGWSDWKYKENAAVEYLKVNRAVDFEEEGDRMVIKREECRICGQIIEKFAKKLMCRHRFHPECIKDYFKRNSGCPKCKVAKDTIL